MKLIDNPSIKTLSLVFMLGVLSVINVRAQQMQDMPYDLHFIDMMIVHHQEAVENGRPRENEIHEFEGQGLCYQDRG